MKYVLIRSLTLHNVVPQRSSTSHPLPIRIVLLAYNSRPGRDVSRE